MLRGGVMSAGDQGAGEQRVRDAVRRHARTRAFAEAEDVISAVLSDPGVREARERVEVAETGPGMELRARLQPFQDRYDQSVAGRRRGRARRGLWGQARPLGADLRAARRARDLDGGTTLGPNGEGRPIAWVGSAPDDW